MELLDIALKKHPSDILYEEASIRKALIVEDDPAIVSIFDALFDEAYPHIQLDWATKAEDAFYLISRQSQFFNESPYELVVADILLEGEGTGIDVWRLIHELYPESPVVLTSSLPLERFLKVVEGETVIPPYLPKPFTIAQCQTLLDEYLLELKS